MRAYEIKDWSKIQYILVWDNQYVCSIGADKGEQIEYFEDRETLDVRSQQLFTGDQSLSTSKFVFCGKIDVKYNIENYDVVKKVRLMSYA